IGRGIAERMVLRGHRVVVTDVDEAAVRRTAGEIGAVEGLAQDIRDRDSHAFVAERAASYGRVVAWFNNAGVGDDGRLSELTDEQVQRLVDVNLLGTLWGMRAALSAFGPEGGDIVNTASLAGLGPVPGYAVYAATKAAVVSASMSVDAETQSSVRVHALCPDGVQTAMLDGQNPTGLGAKLVHSGGRILTVDEVADAAVAMVGSRRVVQAVPSWRGALMRVSATAPSLAKQSLSLLAAQGSRAMQR
ncbi:MAG TPA: SDR family oxidoreductase, partial [Nocardioides sp.]